MSLSSFTRISLLVLFSFAWVAHAQVNPNYPNIRWALATGSGAPSGGACTSANYGQPYTQTTGPHQFVCACDACALLFDHAIGGRFTLTPREVGAS